MYISSLSYEMSPLSLAPCVLVSFSDLFHFENWSEIKTDKYMKTTLWGSVTIFVYRLNYANSHIHQSFQAWIMISKHLH